MSSNLVDNDDDWNYYSDEEYNSNKKSKVTTGNIQQGKISILII